MIVTRTPLRVTLGGGGSDLPDYYSKYEGFIFAAAINKYVFVGIHDLDSNKKTKFHHMKSGIFRKCDARKHDITREALRLTGGGNDFGIFSKSDIPPGTGLGSSGSFTVGILKAIHEMQGEALTPVELAEEACDLEIKILNRPVGKQDQYMAVFGGLRVFRIDRVGEVKIRNANISYMNMLALNKNLKMYYSHCQRDSAKILLVQGRKIRENKKKVIDHMHHIKEIGHAILGAAEKGNLTDIGLLMDKHWKLKKKISFMMSNSFLDHIYQTAKKNGAIGGKIMGAGGGGFFLFYSEKNFDRLDMEMRKLGLKRMDYEFELKGSRVLKNSANSEIK